VEESGVRWEKGGSCGIAARKRSRETRGKERQRHARQLGLYSALRACRGIDCEHSVGFHRCEMRMRMFASDFQVFPFLVQELHTHDGNWDPDHVEAYRQIGCLPDL
jgi:hypothetical protein